MTAEFGTFLGEVEPLLQHGSCCGTNRTMRMSQQPYRILVADDQQAMLDALKLLFRSNGFEVETVRSPQVVLESLALREYDVVLLDLNYTRDTTSGREGINLLERVQEIDSFLPIIVMTAWGTVDLAVDAMRRGARDFVQKPWEDERLIATVTTNAELYRALRRGQRLEAENRLTRTQSRAAFIAESPAMQKVVETIAQVGPSDATVLITGEHGSGKQCFRIVRV